MKNTLWKISVSMLVSLLAALPAYAQDNPEDSNQFVGGDGISVYRCFTEGTLDFSTFIDASINLTFLREVFWEPYIDVIMRNQCHATDIIRLIDQYNAVRSQIRESYLSCETDKIQNLALAYSKIKAELYYVRHIIDGGEDWPSELALNGPFGILSTRDPEDAAVLFYPEDKLYVDMAEKFVTSGEMSRQDFDRHFTLLTAKYAERKNSYVYCDNSPWEEVADKWEEFVETAGGITPAWEDLSQSVSGRAEGIANRLENLVESAGDMSFTDYVTAIASVNINNLDAVEGYNEIVDFVSSTLPEGAYPTRGDVINAVESSEAIFDGNRLRTEIKNEFEALYKTASDDGIKLILEELNEMNKIIEQSLLRLDEVEGCADVVNERQCSSSI